MNRWHALGHLAVLVAGLAGAVVAFVAAPAALASASPRRARLLSWADPPLPPRLEQASAAAGSCTGPRCPGSRHPRVAAHPDGGHDRAACCHRGSDRLPGSGPHAGG
jgi:hypothetical protein